MSKQKLFLYLIVVAVLVQSCTIQKRLYNSGWHVEWRSKQKSSSNCSEKKVFESYSEQTTELEIQKIQENK